LNHRAISNESRATIRAMPFLLFGLWLYVAFYAVAAIFILIAKGIRWLVTSPKPRPVRQSQPLRQEPAFRAPPPMPTPIAAPAPPQAPREPPDFCRVPLTPTERQLRVRALQAGLHA
jgi:hypothetical protein